MIVKRVEQHIVKSNNRYYKMLEDFCVKANNLYNHANYIIRTTFIETNYWIRWTELYKLLQDDKEYPDYDYMPTKQSAQYVLCMLDRNWESFFGSLRRYKENKDLFSGRPKLPKYRKKGDRYVLTLSNQAVKLKNNILKFPKCFNGLQIEPKFIKQRQYVALQQVRIVPKLNYIILEIVYNIEVQKRGVDNNRYMSIDIGVDNLATIVTNFNNNPLIINGKGLKSINQYYNKKYAYYKSIADRCNHMKSTDRLKKLTTKRNFKTKHFLHNASRFIIDEAVCNNVSVIIIGYNKNWKVRSNLRKQVKQIFVQLPFSTFIQMITYKAQEFGIDVILTEESYTSGTSYLDNEPPIKEFYNKKRRIKRGLFKSNNGVFINADVNASYQIMKKVFPNEYSNGIEGTVSYPIKVNVC